ncbi:MAG: cupin domain-containing protein [Candidatus Taylorbacteria bacterium]|nr:cupin domain-containing protein [Candidatus Taylorbacteria bacterium]
MNTEKIFTEKRPWGEFRQYTENESVTVKTIFVKHGEGLSLQYHHKRSEFWRVIFGNPEIVIGQKKIYAKKGDEFVIPTEKVHRLSAPHDDVEILEIASGRFDEGDIVRLEDRYGRS